MNPFDDDLRFPDLDAPDQNERTPWSPESVGANLFIRHAPLGDWAKQAACKDPAVDPVVFDYLDNEEAAALTPAVKAQRQRTAASTCRACPVRAECEQDARDNRAVGIWGGLLFTERGRPVSLIDLLDAGRLNRGPAGRGPGWAHLAA